MSIFRVSLLLFSLASFYACTLGFRLVYEDSKRESSRKSFGCSELEFSLFDDRFGKVIWVYDFFYVFVLIPNWVIFWISTVGN